MLEALSTILVVSISTMIILGLRHGLDVDHISAIDGLVRLHNTSKHARWMGTGFSAGHVLSVLAEMVFVIYTVGSFLKTDNFSLITGFLGVSLLGIIGIINIYSMRKWGRTGPAILAIKVQLKTGKLGPYGSALVTGIVFGLGFDTATQISAISVSAVTSATSGMQMGFILTGFFGLGMISMDTLNSVVLHSLFWRIFDTKGFKFMSYGLSAVAIGVALTSGIVQVTHISIPDWAGPALAISVISTSIGYAYFIKKKKIVEREKNNNFGIAK